MSDTFPSERRSGRSVQQRQDAILAELERHGRVEVGDLSENLSVAEETIRRDLRALEDRALLKRAHGGAIKSSTLNDDLPRITGAGVRSHPIAEAAIALVPESGSIFIDSGEIAESLASMLPDVASLQVVTNSVPVALVASRKSHLDVYNLGGEVDPADGSQTGQWTRKELERIRVDVAFLTADGITADGWLTAPTPKAAAVKSGVVKAADTVVLMVPAGQLAPTGLVKYAHLSDLTALICEERTRGELTGAVEAGVRIIEVKPFVGPSRREIDSRESDNEEPE